jgi:hypothetical protein
MEYKWLTCTRHVDERPAATVNTRKHPKQNHGTIQYVPSSAFRILHERCELRNISANTLRNFFVAKLASTGFATSTITQCFLRTSSQTCSQTSLSRLLHLLLYPNPQSYITAATSSPSTTAAHTLGYPHTIAVKESTTTRIRTNTSRRLHMTCLVAASASSTSKSSSKHIIEVRVLNDGAE